MYVVCMYYFYISKLILFLFFFLSIPVYLSLWGILEICCIFNYPFKKKRKQNIVCVCVGFPEMSREKQPRIQPA